MSSVLLQRPEQISLNDLVAAVGLAMLEQAKIDLAVLLKLFQHAEAHGEAETPREICNLFEIHIPLRRVELALETLERRGEVTREYHPHYADEGLWQISREGLRTIEKALKLPKSFVARANAGGDAWLQSDEAIGATLNRLPRYEEAVSTTPSNLTPPPVATDTPPLSVNISPVISPVFTNAIGGGDEIVARSANRAGWIGALGTWVGVAVAIAIAIVTYYMTS